MSQTAIEIAGVGLLPLDDFYKAREEADLLAEFKKS